MASHLNVELPAGVRRAGDDDAVEPAAVRLRRVHGQGTGLGRGGRKGK